MQLQTLSQQPASCLGLAGQSPMESTCVAQADRAGINTYFFYNLSYTALLSGLKPLAAQKREQMILATGSESRDRAHLEQYFDAVRQTLDTPWLDLFMLEYVAPRDDRAQLQAALDQLYGWQAAGKIRYVGVTTHNRAIAIELLQARACDVLMHRYNMAHRKAEQTVFPAAQATGIPLIAFTATRWGSLLQGHPDWPHPTPTAADCYRMAIAPEAVQLVLTAPKTPAELAANLMVLQAPTLSPSEMHHWQTYGDLVYGMGQDRFETQWP